MENAFENYGLNKSLLVCLNSDQGGNVLKAAEEFDIENKF